MKDELAERRQRMQANPQPVMHPMCRCVALPLDEPFPPEPRSLWQRFKDWRSLRRIKRIIADHDHQQTETEG